jgi:hypothetical protein
VLEQRLNRRVLVFATPRPDSPPDSGEPPFAGVEINRPISPPGSSNSSSESSESSEDEDTDTESGGALLEPPHEGKQRVQARSGKKVTPWATRASSFVSERPSSPELRELRKESEAVAIESDSDEEEEESPPATVETLVPLIHRDTDGIKPSESAHVEDETTDTQENDAVAPLRPSSPLTKPLTGRRSSAQTTSTIASGDEIFEDCPEIPFEEPPSSPSPVILTAKELSVAAAKARVRERFAPPPARTSAPISADDKKVILIFQPPDPTHSQQQQPPKPLLPALNVIPATPQAMSATQEKEKQLGHTPQPLLSRRATGIPGSEDAIPEDEEAVVMTTAQRPSLAEVPEKVRQSKLHPWWRPKRAVEDGGELSHTLSAPSESGVSEEEQELRRRRASTAANGKKNSNGRVVKRIKGTRFVIEFVGWRKILGKRKDGKEEK